MTPPPAYNESPEAAAPPAIEARVPEASLSASEGYSPSAEQPQEQKKEKAARSRLPFEFAPWLTSAAAHAVTILLLSLLALTGPGFGPPGLVLGSADPADEQLLDVDLGAALAGPRTGSFGQSPAAELPQTGSSVASVLIKPQSEQTDEPNEVATGSDGVPDFNAGLMSTAVGGFEGRSRENRRALALSGGGSEASEAAVEGGLAWLAAHQYPDGSWRFDLEGCPGCNGSCRHSGFGRTDTASTGLALLCFLGAGYTHQEGPYQDAVASGIYFLTGRMQINRHGGDLRGRRQGFEVDGAEINRDRNFIERAGLIVVRQRGVDIVSRAGDMYAQGIATLALCEAYGLTGDPELRGPAESAVEFIVNAQYPSGGWRYEPKWELVPEGSEGAEGIFLQADTTITGWQVTALKSALLAGIRVPRPIWYRVGEYLDSVQTDGGSAYGYKSPDKRQSKNRTTSVIGLFCRMMLGWPAEHRPLQKGVARVAERPPEDNHMYMNYYASQVLHHVGGRGWERWNRQMKRYLIESQYKQGHERGSWYFDEEWSTYGGRLYTTTMAILSLEVYYRYLPMYGEAFVDKEP